MKSPSDKVFKLIKSMTKSEKRYFKLCISKYKGNRSKRSVELFDAINKQDVYDEKLLQQKLRTSALKKNLSTHKILLFNTILETLRGQHIEKYDKIKLHEKLDYALLLQDKNLLDIAIEIVDDVIVDCQEKKYYEVEQEALILKMEFLRFNDGERKKMLIFKQKIIDRSLGLSKKIKAKMKLLELQNEMNLFYNVSYQIATQREEVDKIKAFGQDLMDLQNNQTRADDLTLKFALIDWYHYTKNYVLEAKVLEEVNVYFKKHLEKNQALLVNYYAYLQRKICFFYQKRDYHGLKTLKSDFIAFKEKNDLSPFLQSMTRVSCIQIERELVLVGHSPAVNLESMREEWQAQIRFSMAQELDVLRMFMSYYLIIGDYERVLNLYHNTSEAVFEEGAFYTGLVCKYIVMVAEFELDNIHRLEYWVRHIKYVLKKENQYGVIAQLILNFFQKGTKPLAKDYERLRTKFLKLMEDQDGCISELFLIWITAKVERKAILTYYRQGLTEN